MNIEITDRELLKLNDQQKKQYLYNKQKQLLDDFLERNAISKQQYNKSLGDLMAKMGMTE